MNRNLSYCKKVVLSRSRVGRRVEAVAGNVEDTLNCIFCSLATDNRADLTVTARMAIFVPGIVDNFNIIKKLSALTERAYKRH